MTFLQILEKNILADLRFFFVIFVLLSFIAAVCVVVGYMGTLAIFCLGILIFGPFVWFGVDLFCSIVEYLFAKNFCKD